MSLDEQGALMPAYFDTDADLTPLTIKFGFERPPLRHDDRLGKVHRAQLVKHVRTSTIWEARRIPELQGRVEVLLTWYVGDNLRRRPDRMAPTLDAMLLGLGDAGVLGRNQPFTRRYAIKHTDGTPHMTLTLTQKDDR